MNRIRSAFVNALLVVHKAMLNCCMMCGSIPMVDDGEYIVVQHFTGSNFSTTNPEEGGEPSTVMQSVLHAISNTRLSNGSMTRLCACNTLGPISRLFILVHADGFVVRKNIADDARTNSAKESIFLIKIFPRENIREPGEAVLGPVTK